MANERKFYICALTKLSFAVTSNNSKVLVEHCIFTQHFTKKDQYFVESIKGIKYFKVSTIQQYHFQYEITNVQFKIIEKALLEIFV